MVTILAQVTPADPDQMAANMQALAQSITDTGRYIFGERPRPRLNTGDAMTRYAERPRQRLNTTDSVSRRKWIWNDCALFAT